MDCGPWLTNLDNTCVRSITLQGAHPLDLATERALTQPPPSPPPAPFPETKPRRRRWF